MRSAMERFSTKVDLIQPSDRCWLWAGSIDHKGYGRFWTGSTPSNPVAKLVGAHRWLFTQLRHNIPDGMTLDHLCQNKNCVNPEHLEVVSMRVNILRGNNQAAENARKTHCIRGHLFDLANTYIRRSGRRTCIQCEQTRNRRRYLLETAHQGREE